MHGVAIWEPMILPPMLKNNKIEYWNTCDMKEFGGQSTGKQRIKQWKGESDVKELVNQTQDV